MAIKKGDLRLLIPLIIFIIVGIYGAYSKDFLQNDKALSIALRWFIVPSVIIGYYYAYRYTFDYNKAIAPLWRKVSGLLVLTLIFTSLFLKSTQGYLILYNCNVGTQTTTLLKGKITKLKFPRRKKPLNNYTIEIEGNNNEKFNLDVPTKDYVVGQTFEKQMMLGSLNILYSP